MTTCDICFDKIKVPCRSSCTNCCGGNACLLCVRTFYEFDSPLWERKTPKCFSCKNTLDNAKSYIVELEKFKGIDENNDKTHSTCTLCDFVCENQIVLNTHIFTKCPKFHIKCKHCKYNFWGFREFICGDHFENVHSTFDCKFCKKQFSIGNKESHLNTHLKKFKSMKRYYSDMIYDTDHELQKSKYSRADSVVANVGSIDDDDSSVLSCLKD